VHSVHLREPVLIEGKDIFGRDSSIGFYPSVGKNWSWKISPNQFITIRPSIVDAKKRRLTLSACGKKLEFYEHIGILRYFGLIGVQIQANQWPPFHGRALELWSELEQYSIQKELCQRYTVSRPVCWAYSDKRGGHESFTEIAPSTDSSLTLDIFCSYPNLGTGSRTFSLPNLPLLKEMCATHSPGWPPWLHGLSRTADLLGWPHHKNITWGHEFENTSAIDKFILHRAQDILGALSLLCRDGIFVGHITSHCSGHQADLEAVKAADNFLIKI
jgi:hypothetical protein